MQPVETTTKGVKGTGTTTKTGTVKVAKATGKQGAVKFVCGGREATVNNAVGRTPNAMRGDLKTKLGLTKAHDTVFVNGEDVNAKTYRLRAGDEVEYLREAGEKG